MGHATGLLLPDFDLPPGEVAAEDLPPAAQQHLRVLRPRRDERYLFLDGRGGVRPAVVTSDRPLRFRVERVEQRPATQPALTLCLAPPKGDDLWQALTQSTEIGAAKFLFLRSDHAQIAKGQNPPVDRARRVSDASCEQCVRAWRPEIDPEWYELADLLTRPGVHVVADEALADTDPIGFTGAVPPSLRDQAVYYYVGPEGGWSDRERQLFRGKAFTLSLGSLVLRVPTACVAGLHFLRLVSEHSAEP